MDKSLDKTIEELALTESAKPSTSGQDTIAGHMRRILELIGEDANREGLRRTPERYEKAMRFLTAGYTQDPEKLLNGAMFKVCYDNMVVVKDIEMYSLCEHHLLPFFGRAHIGYLPAGRVIGLSKLPRLIDVFAHRLQLQERLTHQIASAVLSVTDSAGVGVVMNARHLCIEMRGVGKPDSETVTSALLGDLDTDSGARAEFLDRVGISGRSR